MNQRGPDSPLAGRFLRLRNWEAFNVLFLPGLFIGVWITRQSDVSWGVRLPPLVLMCAVLAQGAGYWHLKYRSIGNREALPPWFCALYRKVRASLAVGLGGCIFAFSYSVVKHTIPGWDVAWSIGLLGFAALEYINYFWIQLKHDSFADIEYLRRHRRLRTAPLASDLKRHCT